MVNTFASVFDGLAHVFPFKGLATTGPTAWDNTADYQAALNFQATNLTWFYDYAATPGGVIPPGVQYVPMIARLALVDQTHIDAAVASAGPGGYIMLGNEPDGQGEAVGSWITAWETVATDAGVIANNIKLISPSCVNSDGPNGTSAWFATFMAGITHLPYAIALHAYSTNVDPTLGFPAIIGHIDNYRKTYVGFPMWVSETGCFTVPTPTSAQLTTLMQDLQQSFRLVPRCERYAWFFMGPEGYPSEVTANVALNNSDGTARAIAAKYQSLDK